MGTKRLQTSGWASGQLLRAIFLCSPTGKVLSIGTAVSEGMIPTVNMLHVLSGLIPEYDINTTYLDELLQIYPEVRMIQTDAPEVLISALQARGLR